MLIRGDIVLVKRGYVVGDSREVKDFDPSIIAVYLHPSAAIPFLLFDYEGKPLRALQEDIELVFST